MCKTKRKIILFMIIVIGFISITKFVYASDTKIYVTKETNEFIEGTIEFEPEEDNIITLFRDDFGNHMIITYADCVGGFYNLLNLYETRYKANMKKEEKEK